MSILHRLSFSFQVLGRIYATSVKIGRRRDRSGFGNLTGLDADAPRPIRQYETFILAETALACCLALSFVLVACSYQQSIEPLSTTPTPNPTETPTVEPTVTTVAIATSPSIPTEESTATPTIEPTGTPTETPTATNTISATTNGSTPTPGPTTIALNICDTTIWSPGTYKLTNDVKLTKYDCFYIQSSNVVVDCDNHKIEGLNYTGYGFFINKYGFFQETPTNIEIKNCNISRFHSAVFAAFGNNIYIHHNNLSNNKDDINPKTRGGVFLGQTEGGGIRFNYVNGGRIEYNTTTNQAIGIDVRDSERLIVRNNTSTGNSAWGINLQNTSNSQVISNTLKDNIRWCAWGNGQVGPGCDAGGIMLQDGSSHNIVRENAVLAGNGNGIFIKAHGMRCGDYNTIENNKILDSAINAVEFSFCKGNKVIGNEIARSLDAVWFGFSSNTEIRGNTISEMTNHGIISYNSHDSTVADNKIVNSREGIYFYWDTWDPKNFAFLAPSPDKYASRGNLIANNVLEGNTSAAIHLSNSTNNRLLNNTFQKNAKNIWLEGKTDGTTTNGQ